MSADTKGLAEEFRKRSHESRMKDADYLTRLGQLCSDNAISILRCVNAHDALVAALQQAEEYIEWAANATNDVNDGDGVLERVRSAIELVGAPGISP